MKPRRHYNFNGLAGCVQQKVARKTKTLVGVYDSLASGLEADPELPWSTVCEKHGSIVCSTSLANAKASAADPASFCEDCRGGETP